MATESTILVLSDLHFGRDLHIAPELAPIGMVPLIEKAGLSDQLRDFVRLNCRGHSLIPLSKLPRYLQFILHEHGKEGVDLCLLVGDQVTVPDKSSFNFLRGYLTSSRYQFVTDGLQSTITGLGLDPKSIVAIPGNHDKLLLSNLNSYNSEFTDALGLGDKLEPGGFWITLRRLGIPQREILLLLVDANRYASQDNLLDTSALKHLASGEISQKLTESISVALTTIAQTGVIRGEKLEYQSAFKILLVHYAVDSGKLSGKASLSERLLPHDCKGLIDLVSVLRNHRFDLVIHGHLHRPGIFNLAGITVLGATTAGQANAENGFFLITLSGVGEFRVEHHVWNGAAWHVDPKHTMPLPPVRAYGAGSEHKRR